MNKILNEIFKRILNEKILFGEIIIKFTYFKGALTRYDYERRDITLVKEEKNG